MRRRLAVTRCILLATPTLILWDVPVEGESNADSCLLKVSAFTPSPSHTRSNDIGPSSPFTEYPKQRLTALMAIRSWMLSDEVDRIRKHREH